MRLPGASWAGFLREAVLAEAGSYLGDMQQDLHGVADDLHAGDAAVTAPDQEEYLRDRSAAGHVLTAPRGQPRDDLWEEEGDSQPHEAPARRGTRAACGPGGGRGV